jgi:hypothetical protein
LGAAIRGCRRQLRGDFENLQSSFVLHVHGALRGGFGGVEAPNLPRRAPLLLPPPGDQL